MAFVRQPHTPQSKAFGVRGLARDERYYLMEARYQSTEAPRTLSLNGESFSQQLGGTNALGKIR